MISSVWKNLAAFGLLALLAAQGGACGNYSNDDLEYMSIIPQRDELASNLPRTTGALTSAAELYQTTNGVSDSLNGLLDRLLGLIDTVRHLSPSERKPTSRTWGPFPSPEHPAWLTKMQISRDLNSADDMFSYWLGFVPRLDRRGEALHVIDGTFTAGSSLRQSSGTLKIATAEARAKGIDLRMEFLDHLEIKYDVVGPTVTVHMDITNLPNPLKPEEALFAMYDYAVVADGRGAMRFDFWANSIPGPAGVEHFRITSRWLPTGEGRGDVSVVEGDAAGAMQTECWDNHFQPTYNSKPWGTPLENSGDPSACAEIPPAL